LKKLLYILFIVFSVQAFAQSKRIDSIQTRVEINKTENNFGKLFVCYAALKTTYTELEDTNNIVHASIRMADACRSSGSHVEALNILRDLADSPYHINPLQEIGFCLVKGSIYYELNLVDSSIVWAKKGLNICFKNNITSNTALLYNLLGASYASVNPDSALHYIQLSINVYLSRNDTSGVALPYINMARLYTDKKQMKKGEAMIFNAIAYLDKKDELVYRKMAYDFLARLYTEEKNYKQAVKYLTLRDSVYYAINSNEIKFKIEQFQSKLKQEKTENERILLQGKVELAEFESKSKTNFTIISSILVITLGLLLLFAIKNAKTRREVNSLIAKKADELESLNTFKNKMISVISHDMRTPLAQIITLHQAKNSGLKFSDVELSEMELTILASTKSGLLILDNLLKWANSQLSGLAVKKEQFNSVRLLSHILNQVSQIAKEKNIQIQTQLEEVSVFTDEGLFEIVMRNILSNAIKFSPEKSVIKIGSTISDGYLKITVLDQGPGIPQSVIEKLHAKEVIKPKKGSFGEKGAGIGLTFSLEFAKKAGGNLVCAKGEQGGTLVTFTVPMKD